MEKPHFIWSVKAEWLGVGNSRKVTDFNAELNVVAQDEDDAWAHFCDKLGAWPSRRECSLLKFKKGKQVDASLVSASHGDTLDGEEMFPKERLTAKKTYTSLA